MSNNIEINSNTENKKIIKNVYKRMMLAFSLGFLIYIFSNCNYYIFSTASCDKASEFRIDYFISEASIYIFYMYLIFIIVEGSIVYGVKYDYAHGAYVDIKKYNKTLYAYIPIYVVQFSVFFLFILSNYTSSKNLKFVCILLILPVILQLLLSYHFAVRVWLSGLYRLCCINQPRIGFLLTFADFMFSRQRWFWGFQAQ